MNKKQFKFKTGLVIGKFYPPHKGHKFLIDTAVSQCEKVTVIICWKPSEIISGKLRGQWLKTIHPDVKVKVLKDYQLGDDDSQGWAKFTVKYLGFTPDAVFTSEDYGHDYAKFMGCTHVQVDKTRHNVPISGTLVRSNPHKYFEFLEPCVRAYFTKRIAVVGAESTGTTTLSKALAKYYKTTWAPEYGRIYSEGKLYSSKAVEWQSKEFEEIATAQNILEDQMAQQSPNGLVICDTDAFATSIWHERYMKSKDPKLEHIAETNHHDLYILTGDEIPWEDDGTRDGKDIRHWMHQRFIQRLKADHKRFVMVSGSPETRLKKAVYAIEQNIMKQI